jgi:hypothetical protein
MPATPPRITHWPILDDSDNLIIKEIEQQTDRGAALIATSYLEHRLLLAIQARTVRNEKIESEIYKGAGPLGSLSAKIDLGLLLGIYDVVVHKILDTIRRIRNEFAHKATPINFSSEKIAALCKNIELAGEVLLEDPTGKVESMKFQMIPDGTPRTTFINAVRATILALEMETKHLPLRRPAEPVMSGLGSFLRKP